MVVRGYQSLRMVRGRRRDAAIARALPPRASRASRRHGVRHSRAPAGRRNQRRPAPARSPPLRRASVAVACGTSLPATAALMRATGCRRDAGGGDDPALELVEARRLLQGSFRGSVEASCRWHRWRVEVADRPGRRPALSAAGGRARDQQLPLELIDAEAPPVSVAARGLLKQSWRSSVRWRP